MNYSAKSLLVLGLFISICLNHCKCQNGSWDNDFAVFPQYIINYTAELIGDEIFIIGGAIRTESNMSNAHVNEMMLGYNLTTNSWNLNVGVMKYPRNYLASLTHDNKIYLFGGVNTFGKYYKNDSIDVIDPLSGAWWELEKLTSDRMGSSACVIGNKFYLIGGTNFINSAFIAMRLTQVYDLDKPGWTRLKNLPIPLGYCTAIAVNKDIYVFGGDSLLYENPEPVFLRYDTEMKIWDTGLSKADFTGSAGGCRFGDYIYVFGGRSFASLAVSEGYGSDKIFMYDIEEDFWLEVGKMPFGLWMLKALVKNDKIYLVGGKNNHDLEKEQKAGYFPSIFTYTPVKAPIYSIKTDVSKPSLCFPEDSLLIKAKIVNHYDYPFVINASYYGRNTAKGFETQLFDDGLHNDGEANDNLFGGYSKHPGIEDIFDVRIESNNLEIGEKFVSGQDCRSICTLGPLEIENFHISNTATNDRGEIIVSFTIDIINKGEFATAENISIQLFALSDSIRVVNPSSQFGNILAGTKKTSKTEFSLIIPSQTKIPIAELSASIIQDGISYWNQELELDLDRWNGRSGDQ